MSNSSLVNYTLLSPNCSSPRNHVIDTITIHCVVGQCTVEALGNEFVNAERRASANYGIGYDGRIGMYVEEKDRSWCSGSSTNDNRAITIEVACDTYAPYAITDAAYAALIDLCTDICVRNGIDALRWEADPDLIGQVDRQNMTVHRWFQATECPGETLFNLHYQIADDVNQRLRSVHGIGVSGTGNVAGGDQSGFDNEPADWGREAIEFAVQNGILYGDQYGNYHLNDTCTRQQVLTFLYRYYQLLK